MRGLVSILLAAGSAAAFFGVAAAQPSGAGPRAILFDQPNFQGASITIVEGAPDLQRRDFGRAMSGRFEGGWTVCDAPDLDGRCMNVRGDVSNLTEVGLTRIVSLGEEDMSDSSQMTDAGPSSNGYERADRYATANEDARPDQDARSDPDDERVPARIGGEARAFAAPPAPPPSVAAAPPSKPASIAALPPVAAVAPAPPVTVASATPPPPSFAVAAPPPPTAAAPPAAVASPLPPATPAAVSTTSASKRRSARLQLAAAAAHPATSSVAAVRGDGDAGQSAVFFAKPMKGGAEVAIDVQGPANQFCREQGLGPAVYFDTDGHTLRDVLCRRP